MLDAGDAPRDGRRTDAMGWGRACARRVRRGVRRGRARRGVRGGAGGTNYDGQGGGELVERRCEASKRRPALGCRRGLAGAATTGRFAPAWNCVSLRDGRIALPARLALATVARGFQETRSLAATVAATVSPASRRRKRKPGEPLRPTDSSPVHVGITPLPSRSRADDDLPSCSSKHEHQCSPSPSSRVGVRPVPLLLLPCCHAVRLPSVRPCPPWGVPCRRLTSAPNEPSTNPRQTRAGSQASAFTAPTPQPRDLGLPVLPRRAQSPARTHTDQLLEFPLSPLEQLQIITRTVVVCEGWRQSAPPPPRPHTHLSYLTCVVAAHAKQTQRRNERVLHIVSHRCVELLWEFG